MRMFLKELQWWLRQQW